MTKTYKAVKISRGKSGWGGPLVVQPTPERNKVVSVTGGGIHPVAARIAEMTGAEAVDGFKAPPVEGEMAVVVVDCGGTARCGVYPRKRIPTVNLTPVGQAGPLAQFITEDIYVSGVKEATSPWPTDPEARDIGRRGLQRKQCLVLNGGKGGTRADQRRRVHRTSFSIGRVMGRVVNIFFNAGRRTIDQVVRNVLPFMAFVTMLIGLILYTGIGDVLAQPMGPLANNIVGLLIISAICGLPFLSPILGPGAVIAQVIGVRSSARRLPTARSRRRWRCRRCLPTIPRSAATSFRSAWRSARPSPRPSRSAFPPF
jgi:PTS system glucitol/sorbitol-specific IIB component